MVWPRKAFLKEGKRGPIKIMFLVIKYLALFPAWVKLSPTYQSNHVQLFLFSARDNAVYLTISGN